MDKILIAKTLFSFFYFKFYGYKPSFSDREEKMFQNFLSKIDRVYGLNGVGINFFIDYMSYAWNFYLGNTGNGQPKRKVTPGWIVGPKMFDRWIKKIENYDSSYEYRLYRKLNTNRSKIRSELEFQFSESEDISDISTSEENEKRRFGDSLAQLYHCIQFTTLFNPKSVNCILCKQKVKCRQIKNGINPGFDI